jgi:hypothetical protein
MNRSDRQHPLDGYTVDEIRRLPLPGTGFLRRGYDKSAVDKILADLASYVDELRVELASTAQALRYREQEIEHRRYGVRLPSTGQGDLVNEEQLAWHIEAQRYGDQVTATAQAQAGQIVEDAQRHADRILAAALPSDGEVEQLRAALRGMRRLLHYLAQHIDMAEELTQRG